MSNRQPVEVVIREERPADFDAIEQLVRHAFNDEEVVPLLVRRIRDSENYLPRYSLVAEHEGQVVGHVMLSYVELDDGAQRHRVLTLSPLAVAADFQGRGIGSTLVREVLARAEQGGEPLVLLEGSPRYYPRLGFEPAAAYGIRIDLPSWAAPEAAQLYRLSGYSSDLRGRLVYPPAFDHTLTDR